MKVPIRPAPPPPTSNGGVRSYPKQATRSDKLPPKDFQARPVVSSNKKKPPPRPPPPNFAVKKDKRQVPTRPSQLITNLFQRKSQAAPGNMGNSKLSKSYSELNELKSGVQTSFLIDFSSPPSSPTFTTRSSSDCVSVNSFGSDGITPCSTSSGNTSNVESGFEDDFELFGGFPSRKSDEKDPWSLLSQEVSRPRNPSPLACSAHTVANGTRGAWVTFSSPAASKKMVPTMPTIIRAKPERPRDPPNFANKPPSVDLLSDVFGSTSLQASGTVHEDDEDEEWSSSESPPMPTGPPPAPPAEVLSAMLNNLPMSRSPHGVALYDYQGTQPGDLTVSEGDTVYLVRKVDDNWFIGLLDGVEGAVPANFLRVVVPLHNWEVKNLATALYAFQPETWGDLGLSEGDVVKVTARIDQDWLYGECDGKSGQFPASFVDHVPNDLPVRSGTQ